MATATATREIQRLTEAHRAAQARKAALIAALVAAYFKTRVNVEDPASVERWLELLIPRIQREHSASASLAATYGDALRLLELPGVKDGFKFQKAAELSTEQVRTSLTVVGPASLRSKYAQIRELDPQRFDAADKQGLMRQADEVAARRVAGAVVRHVQNGGRQALFDGVKEDRVALGYIRVTREKPCYFCAMLASRGLVYLPYGKDSFEASNARFTGDGTVKVHDFCECSLKPAYDADDPFLEQSKRFEEMWNEYSSGSSGDAVKSFRQGYEGRAK